MSTVSNIITGRANRKAGRQERAGVAAGAQAQIGREEEALTSIQGGFEGAKGFLEPFQADDPTKALNLLRAITGALGPEAQEQAFSGVEEGPGIGFLREQGTRQINRSGAVGGTRLAELQMLSNNLATQDLNNQISRQIAGLGGLAEFDVGLARELGGFELGLGREEAGSSRMIGAILNNKLREIAQIRARGTRETGQNKADIFQSSLQDIATIGGFASGVPGLGAAGSAAGGVGQLAGAFAV